MRTILPNYCFVSDLANYLGVYAEAWKDSNELECFRCKAKWNGLGTEILSQTIE